jgi:hypothetical protein
MGKVDYVCVNKGNSVQSCAPETRRRGQGPINRLRADGDELSERLFQ